MRQLFLSMCFCGAFTGLVLLLFPSGETGAAGRRAVSVCYLLEIVRQISVLWEEVSRG